MCSLEPVLILRISALSGTIVPKAACRSQLSIISLHTVSFVYFDLFLFTFFVFLPLKPLYLHVDLLLTYMITLLYFLTALIGYVAGFISRNILSYLVGIIDDIGFRRL